VEPKRRTARTALKALGTVVDVVGLASGQPAMSQGGLGSVLVMMALGLLGFVVFVCVFVAAGLVIVLFGLDHGPYVWLGSVVAWAGFVGGLGVAAIVMLRLLRRHRRLVGLAGFGDRDSTRGDGAGPSSIVAARARTAALDPYRLRELDAHLAVHDDPAVRDAESPADPPRGRS
jgi:hypothetical protein